MTCLWGPKDNLLLAFRLVETGSLLFLLLYSLLQDSWPYLCLPSHRREPLYLALYLDPEDQTWSIPRAQPARYLLSRRLSSELNAGPIGYTKINEKNICCSPGQPTATWWLMDPGFLQLAVPYQYLSSFSVHFHQRVLIIGANTEQPHQVIFSFSKYRCFYFKIHFMHPKYISPWSMNHVQWLWWYGSKHT